MRSVRNGPGFFTGLGFSLKAQVSIPSISGWTRQEKDGRCRFIPGNALAAGTYSIEGYSITLRYNNGKVSTQSFYFYPDSKDFFGIGNCVYIPEKKK